MEGVTHQRYTRMEMLLPPGISNSGNICFASSILQCLFNQQLFREVLQDIVVTQNSSSQKY